MSLSMSARLSNFVEGAAPRWSSEDCMTRRELGVVCKMGRRVRARCIWDRWFTWKWESRPSVVSQ